MKKEKHTRPDAASAPDVGLTTIPAFTIPAGQSPVEDKVDAAGAMELRGWQVHGFGALRGRPRRILLAPTGSGKSTLIKALACDELASDPARKVVIAVPQTLIGDSFDAADLHLDGGPVRWSVGRRLLDGSGTIDALIAFLRGEGDGARSLVCTHQALVLAHQKMMRGHKGKRSPWAGVSLYIDEAHHSHAADAGEEELVHNRLGQVVAHWLERKPGPLLLATATWMRSNLLDIIPKSRQDDFTRFVRSMEEHLASMRYLREVSFRFLLGQPEEALRAIFAEGNRKTIVYLPHVASAHTRAKGGKLEALAELSATVPAGTRTLDFVTEEGRDDRKALLRQGIKAGGGEHTPDVLWALNLGKEGFDWPELERAVVIGERGSIPDVLQMMGRVLRDHLGKARAEFNIVLPLGDKAKADVDQLRLYIKTILASLVVEWPLRLPSLGKGKAADVARRAVEQAFDDPQKAAALIGAVVDGAIRQGDHQANPDKVIGDAITGAKLGLGEPEKKALAAQIRAMFSARTQAMIRDSEGLPFDVAMVEDVFGCVRILAARFGYRTLGEMREALGDRTVIATEEMVRDFAKGKSVVEYDAQRPNGFPAAAHSQRLYGKTYRQIRDGIRNNRVEVTVTEEQAREFAAGKSKQEYNATRPSGYPNAARFIQYFGKSYLEVRDGRRGYTPVAASADQVRVFSQGKTMRAYDAQKPSGYPYSNHFQRHFGMTFSELRDGVYAKRLAAD